jgi:PBP1b-binding outer membrane lipoprotein LpoB
VDKVIDLSGDWNDTDSRETAKSMIDQCFSQSWLTDFLPAHGRKPAIRVRGIVNKTDEHIDALNFIKTIEKAMVNSGKVRVLAQAGEESAVMRDEQREAVSGEQDANTPVRTGKAMGADFVVSVRIGSIQDQIRGKRVKFYQIDFELIQSSTGEKVFVGEHQIKKYVTQPGARW